MPGLDAPTQPRSAGSTSAHRPAPPPRRPPRPRTVVPPTAVAAPPAAAPSTPAPVQPARRRGVALLVGSLAAGLLTGAAVSALGVDVLARSGGGATVADATRAVDHLGVVGTGPSPVSVTFTTDTGPGVPLLHDQVTYRAVGTVTASVDLSHVSPSDIRVTGAAATVRIPAAQLGSPVVDPGRSGIVNQNDNFLNRVLGNGDASASDLQDAASSHLSDQANSQGVPEAAAGLAAADVRAALRRLGITTVRVTNATS